MISEHYISYDIEPFSPELSVDEAIKRMHAQSLELMPVVKDERLLNYVSIIDLKTQHKKLALAELNLFAPVLPFMTQGQHLFTALSQLKTLGMSLLAVLDAQGYYQGILRTKDVVLAISQSLSIRNSGSILVIRLKPIDYSLSDISRIIEYSDAKVLGFLVFEVEESNELDIHIKLNTSSIKHVLATLERYDYNVIQTFNREDQADYLDQRYENLMKFIDV